MIVFERHFKTKQDGVFCFNILIFTHFRDIQVFELCKLEIDDVVSGYSIRDCEQSHLVCYSREYAGKKSESRLRHQDTRANNTLSLLADQLQHGDKSQNEEYLWKEWVKMIETWHQYCALRTVPPFVTAHRFAHLGLFGFLKEFAH